MSLNVAIQMDPIDRINLAGDSSFALLLEAQTRGHRLSYYTPDRLGQIGADIFARVQPLQVQDVAGAHADAGDGGAAQSARRSTSCCCARTRPSISPTSPRRIFSNGSPPQTLVVNDPAAVRNAPEKIMVTEFSELMPPTLITRDREEIEAFRHGLRGGGDEAALWQRGRRRVQGGAPRREFRLAVRSVLHDIFREPWVVQEFLPQVMAGDKRIILVDGEPLGAVNRLPQGDDIRSNMVRGGRAVHVDLTAGEREICARIGPELKKSRSRLRRHRRDRRPYHRDQRHFAHGLARHQAAWRTRSGGFDLGGHRAPRGGAMKRMAAR